MDRPHIICHILQSLNGKIAGNFLKTPEAEPLLREYARIRDSFGATAFAYGAATLREMFFRERRPSFATKPARNVLREDCLQDAGAERRLIAIDPDGELEWADGVARSSRPTLNGAHVVEILIGSASDARIAHLKRAGVSCVFAGERELDLSLAMRKLKKYFGIDRMLLQGGGITDSSFLAEGLIDELSLVTASIAEYSAAATLFDTSPFLKASLRPAVYELKEAAPLEGGLWLHYVRSGKDDRYS